jgi:hypothetical protein
MHIKNLNWLACRVSVYSQIVTFSMENFYEGIHHSIKVENGIGIKLNI